eukprot:TRINITY_DN4685_c0_g1_i1.p1 TRINITY_DN4685_c0_g1~~TRINITY_DN4685_c0_g1_i1.p1  ORF type:complete len:149 (+),score=17.58 TRINITY_DN4685_c0_g1_i1:35-448(+)
MSGTQEDCCKFLLLFNTHLDPMNVDDAQVKQLRELVEFMDNTVLQFLDKWKIDSSKLGVLLCGDFNIGSTTRVYRQLHDILSGSVFTDGIDDLYANFAVEQKLEDTPTYDEANSLTVWNSQRIDYVLRSQGMKNLSW